MDKVLIHQVLEFPEVGEPDDMYFKLNGVVPNATVEFRMSDDNGVLIPVGIAGEGATTFAELTDKATVDLPVVNTPLSTALGLKASGANLTSHTTDNANPHGVTKTQVGLPNAENTLDVNKVVATAGALTNPVNINGISFDGSTSITVTCSAGSLTGTTLAPTVLTSSLTTVGTITGGEWQGGVIAAAYMDLSSKAAVNVVETYIAPTTALTSAAAPINHDITAYANSTLALAHSSGTLTFTNVIVGKSGTVDVTQTAAHDLALDSRLELLGDMADIAAGAVNDIFTITYRFASATKGAATILKNQP